MRNVLSISDARVLIGTPSFEDSSVRRLKTDDSTSTEKGGAKAWASFATATDTCWLVCILSPLRSTRSYVRISHGYIGVGSNVETVVEIPSDVRFL